MKWSNLKQNKCPKCDKLFDYGSFKLGFILCFCGFSIRERRYSEIVNSQITSALEDKWNNDLEGGERNG